MAGAIVVGISDCKYCGEPGVSLTTYALGSCVGIALHDSSAKVGALLHVLLPLSSHNTREQLNPYMFADTGIERMVREVVGMGAGLNRLTARIAGGANMLNSSSVLDIGRKNIQSSLELLERLKIPVMGSSVGGTVGRSMQLEVGSGRVLVRYLGGGEIAL